MMPIRFPTMLRRLLVLFFTVWGYAGLAGLTLVSTAGAEPVFPPGLRIGLEPPAGLVVSKRFTGFEDIERKSAITILDLPARAFEDLERSAFAKKQQDVEGLKRQIFPFAGGIGILITGIGKEGGVTIHKWFLLAKASSGEVSDLATLVTVLVPEPALGVYSDAVVRKALASVTFRPTPIKEQLGMVPFVLNELAGFRVMKVLPEGGVILTEGPADDINRQPYMIVSVGPGAPVDAGDRSRFANNMLSSAPLRSLRIQGSEPMRIHGGPGHEIRAQAESLLGNPVSVVQWVRFSGSGYMRIIGVTARDKWDALFTRFRAVRDGVEFR